MNTEIIKIIEGGLNRDRSKVIKFAKLLSKNSIESGNNMLSKRIDKLFNSSNGLSYITADSLSPIPVDTESRLDMAEITNPSENNNDLILSPIIKTQINNFIKGVKYKEKIQSHSIEVQHSLLLYGPPGCGKTSAAAYIANELQLPLVTTMLDSLVSSLLGNTSKNIKKIFNYANNKPCILFLDEFDAIAKARDDSNELGELKRVVNSLLQNIDKYVENNILIAATNHHQMLDSAIWRRFNETICINKPGTEERLNIIDSFLQKYPNEILNDNKKRKLIVSLIEDFSPSDIKSLCSIAIKNNIVNDNTVLTFEEFLYEFYCYNKNSEFSTESLVQFLSANSVTQNSIQKLLNISIRQVRNILSHS